MEEIEIVLSKAALPGSDPAWTHVFPEKSPRWSFARIATGSADAATRQAMASDDLAVTALPLGPRTGPGSSGPLALWVVFTNPAEGKEDEYNAWYDGRHVADTLAIPGFVASRRYKVTSTTGPEGANWAYLALFEIELDRVAEALAEAFARAGTDRMPNPGMLAPGTAALPFRPA